MTGIDWAIVGFVVVLFFWGYSQGIIVSALTLAGFVGGAVLGARIAPHFLDLGASSPYAPLLTMVSALVIGALVATVLEGLGGLLKGLLGQGLLAHMDSLGGALLTAALGFGVAWVLAAVVAQTPQLSDIRRLVQRSQIVQKLNDELPPSGPILKILARFDPIPQISGPRADVARPNPAIAKVAGVRKAAAGVVRVIGTACGYGVQGSGWVGAHGVVVTNAHVVAGEDDTQVQIGLDGASHDARAIYFNTKDDIALLKVDGLATGSLQVVQQVKRGTDGAVLGYPENGPYRVEPARAGSTVFAFSKDAYGAGPVQRSIMAFRGDVRHGNSGGPFVDRSGKVLATVFAEGKAADVGYGVPNSVVEKAFAQADSDRSVGTGHCAS